MENLQAANSVLTESCLRMPPMPSKRALDTSFPDTKQALELRAFHVSWELGLQFHVGPK